MNEDGTESTYEDFFMGIFHVEGIDQNQIVTWGNRLKCKADMEA